MSDGQYHAYLGLLVVSGLLLSVLAAHGFGQSKQARWLDGAFSAGFLLYAVYLLLADPVEVYLFYYAFAAPIIGAYHAWRSWRQKRRAYAGGSPAQPPPLTQPPFPGAPPQTAQPAHPTSPGMPPQPAQLASPGMPSQPAQLEWPGTPPFGQPASADVPPQPTPSASPGMPPQAARPAGPSGTAAEWPVAHAEAHGWNADYTGRRRHSAPDAGHHADENAGPSFYNAGAGSADHSGPAAGSGLPGYQSSVNEPVRANFDQPGATPPRHRAAPPAYIEPGNAAWDADGNSNNAYRAAADALGHVRAGTPDGPRPVHAESPAPPADPHHVGRHRARDAEA